LSLGNLLIMSSNKKWLLKKPYPNSFAEKFPGYNPVILSLLYSRGLDTQEKIDEFLNPDYSQDIHNPFLFQDMKKACELILDAIKNNSKILIYGDYDADGTTASAVLFNSLKKLKAQNVNVFIPHRKKDGYGLNMKNVEKFIQDKVDLLITVDCGITNVVEVEKLKSAGVKVIITDHHMEKKELPKADAILNCSLQREKYPFKKLAGVGMAFKLCQALFQSQKKPQEFEAFEKWLLDLVTIGTIGDVSPILGENRALVKYGLMVLNKTQRKGLHELIRVASLSNGHDPNGESSLGEEVYDLSVRKVSFQLVPRINSTGRIADANISYKLLITEDEAEAVALARDIQNKNLERQKMAEEMMKEAENFFGEVKDNQKILIVSSENWLSGMVGLGAGKLKDKFARPVILFSQNKEEFTGSGRSIPEFNITEAVNECGELTKKCGGHSQACGITIINKENFDKFIKKINKIANEKLKDVELIPSIEVDVEAKLADLNWELWNKLEKFEPFAEANPTPLFMLKRIKIESMEVMGKNNNHLRFSISQGKESKKAISFFTAEEWYDKIKAGDLVDLVVEFGVNEWNGKRELQFKIIDFKKI